MCKKYIKYEIKSIIVLVEICDSSISCNFCIDMPSLSLIHIDFCLESDNFFFLYF